MLPLSCRCANGWEYQRCGILRLEDTSAKRDRAAPGLLEIKIKALFEANNSEYGYQRIHAALVRGGGVRR